MYKHVNKLVEDTLIPSIRAKAMEIVAHSQGKKNKMDLSGGPLVEELMNFAFRLVRERKDLGA